MELRRIVAEAGLDFDAIQAALKAGDLRNKLKIVEASSEDIDELVQLVEKHFDTSLQSKGQIGVVKNEDEKAAGDMKLEKNED